MTGNEDFASLFGEFEKKQGMTSKKEPGKGDRVTGTVVSIQGDDIFIDLGSKTEGIVEREELTDDDETPPTPKRLHPGRAGDGCGGAP